MKNESWILWYDDDDDDDVGTEAYCCDAVLHVTQAAVAAATTISSTITDSCQ